MADSKISDLPAVVTAAETDEFAVNQSGTTKKQTLAQVRGDLRADVLLDSTLSSPASSFSITGVDDQDYDWVEILMWAQSSVSAVGEYIYIAFNSDTTVTNYRSSRHYSGTTHGHLVADTPMCGEVTGDTAPADAYTPVRILVIAPGSSQYKSWLYETIELQVLNSSMYHNVGGGSWENTSAITQIDITSVGSNNFISGSRCLAIGYRVV